MVYSEMTKLLRFLVDDTVDPAITTTLLNAGQDEMAIEVKAKFPHLVLPTDNSTFVFDEKYHVMPVLFAAAMYKTYDSSVRESDALMNQFREKMPNFTENYQVPYRYRDDFNIQQFRSVADSREFTITKDGYNRRYTKLRVYLNDVKVTATASTDEDTFEIDADYTVVTDDYVTVIWENNADMEAPPFSWWEGMP